MFTVFASPTHVLSEQLDMPTLKDNVGGGAVEFRRLHTRALRSWELNVPGQHEKLDSLIGLLEHLQGDNPFWFDGAGMLEIIEPIIISIGDGLTAEIILPHRHVFVASAVLYLNGVIFNGWAPVGDGITMDALIFDDPIPANAQVTAKYNRKAKVILETQESLSRDRIFRAVNNGSQSVYRVRHILKEVAV